MWTVTLADLRMRARQFAIAVVGATLVFAMALLMAGLSGGFRAEARRTVAAVGADWFVVPAGAGGPFSSPAEVPGKVVDVARRFRGVTAVDPLVVIPTITVAGPTKQVLVHLVGSRVGGMGAPRATSGREPRSSYEAVVDDLTHLRIGQTFSAAGRKFTVVGRVHGFSYFAGTPTIYVPIAGARAVAFGGRPDVTALAIRGTPTSVPKQAQLLSPSQVRDDLLRALNNGLQSIDIITWFLWIVAVVIIGAVVYLSALERKQDFAVLKAIGSSARWLYSGLAVQAATIAVLAAVLAIGLEPLLQTFIPMPLEVPVRALWLLPPVAVLIGLLASLSGLRQTLRADPALAFGSR